MGQRRGGWVASNPRRAPPWWGAQALTLGCGPGDRYSRRPAGVSGRGSGGRGATGTERDAAAAGEGQPAAGVSAGVLPRPRRLSRPGSACSVVAAHVARPGHPPPYPPRMLRAGRDALDQPPALAVPPSAKMSQFVARLWTSLPKRIVSPSTSDFRPPPSRSVPSRHRATAGRPIPHPESWLPTREVLRGAPSGRSGANGLRPRALAAPDPTRLRGPVQRASDRREAAGGGPPGRPRRPVQEERACARS